MYGRHFRGSADLQLLISIYGLIRTGLDFTFFWPEPYEVLVK